MGRRFPELQRASRILEIVSRISSRPRLWTRAGLAQHFEISERQITKDLDIIRHGLKFVLNYERGGGYYFERVPNLPAVSYSLAEALAIYLSAEAGRRMVGIPQEDLSAALARLSSIMPEELGPLLISGTMMPPPPVRDPHRESTLADLYHAVANRNSLEIEYVPASRPSSITNRKIDPYAVLPTGNSWHVVAWCHLRQDARIFKIDRIRSLAATSESFERDPEFDVEDFLEAGWGITRIPDQPAESIELIFEGPSAYWVAEEKWHPTQEVEWLHGGQVRFCLQVPVTEEFSRWVLSYGSYCQVIAPDSLRDWIEAQVREMLNRMD
ncbi:MAG: YafY family transcriptional regulator [Sphaerobacteraceae bacterium]|nr:MAG: YafY family transcriptional regulator [Sphaerobacteraceae bacterium]